MFLINLLILLCVGAATAPVTRLHIEIQNIQKSGGTLRVGIYKPGEKFKTATPFMNRQIRIEKPGVQRVEFELAPGTYAVALYHDLNDNNKIDKHFFGYPKEPFGLSNNFRPLFSAPEFHDCAIELPVHGKSISIALID
ncbi:DUF2141 domain-containing protein [Persicitalea jodogahamensis]|nr:DUF2141 domain-containing protein [Persicitalea jodogahamensis]